MIDRVLHLCVIRMKLRSKWSEIGVYLQDSPSHLDDPILLEVVRKVASIEVTFEGTNV